MILLAIRHLPTKLNRLGVLQGRSNAAIEDAVVDNELIQTNLRTIREYQPQIVASSPLQRAVQTASLYGFVKDELIIDERLVEYDFGEFELQEKSSLSSYQGNAWFERFTQVEFGEGFPRFNSRIDGFLKEYASHKCVLIFSHGVVIRYLYALSAGYDPDFVNQQMIKNNQLVVASFGQ